MPRSNRKRDSLALTYSIETPIADLPLFLLIHMTGCAEESLISVRVLSCKQGGSTRAKVIHKVLLRECTTQFNDNAIVRIKGMALTMICNYIHFVYVGLKVLL